MTIEVGNCMHHRSLADAKGPGNLRIAHAAVAEIDGPLPVEDAAAQPTPGRCAFAPDIWSWYTRASSQPRPAQLRDLDLVVLVACADLRVDCRLYLSSSPFSELATTAWWRTKPDWLGARQACCTCRAPDSHGSRPALLRLGKGRLVGDKRLAGIGGTLLNVGQNPAYFFEPRGQ